jgi:hypothetical protein
VPERTCARTGSAITQESQLTNREVAYPAVRGGCAVTITTGPKERQTNENLSGGSSGAIAAFGRAEAQQYPALGSGLVTIDGQGMDGRSVNLARLHAVGADDHFASDDGR